MKRVCVCLCILCGYFLPCVLAAQPALPVTDGLQFWFNATDSATIFDQNGLMPGDVGFTGSVAEWRDKSANAITATSDKTLPAYDATGMNGLPTIYFSGSRILFDSEVTSSDETVFVVTRMVDDGDNRGPWIGNTQDGQGHGVPGSFFNDNDRYFVATSDGLFGWANESSPITDTIIVERRANALFGIDENGTTVLSGLSAPGTMRIDTIGYFPFGERTFLGEISEILFYDRALTDSELNDVGFYLANKYDIDTPYVRTTPDLTITIPGGSPQECSNINGSSLEFAATVILPPGDAISEVQWFLDDASIGFGGTLTTFVSLGAHVIQAVATTVLGKSGESSEQVEVIDTTTPEISLSLTDRKGNPVTEIVSGGPNVINVNYAATDICDPVPTAVAIGGVPIADGDQLQVAKKDGLITVDGTSVDIRVTATDASGNVAEREESL